MNLENDIPVLTEASDASLVSACLDGDRQAFGKIVTRYQRMLCSVAYSSLGSISESEDVAQEAFVEAWKKLRDLREPEKLKSWLCGILRFKISHRRRKDARQPVSGAGELEEAHTVESNEQGTEEVTMREEEQALLWQALEKVPETYREPLVLFYREHRSVEHVAYELDLSEDAVKQRLSRGRKLLQEKMMIFVEDALARSTPGRVFTMGVLAALPTLAPSAKAAGVGATAVQVGSWFKWLSVAAFVASVSGLVSSFFAIRAGLDGSRTPLERRHVVKTAIALIGISIGFCVVMFLLRMAALEWYEHSGYIAIASQMLVFAFILFMPVATFRLLNTTRALRTAERKRRPDLFLDPKDHVGSKSGEYKSKATLFGVPLVHAKYATPDVGDGPAFGWIAAGDRAYGVLFAWGGFAVAPISVGLVSVGFLTCGTVGLGVLSTGMVSIGLVAFGAVAVGVNAFASLSALGWEMASGGGFAIAKEYAWSVLAFGRHANDEVAQAAISNVATAQSQLIVFCLIATLVIVPVALYAKQVRKKLGKKTD